MNLSKAENERDRPQHNHAKYAALMMILSVQLSRTRKPEPFPNLFSFCHP